MPAALIEVECGLQLEPVCGADGFQRKRQKCTPRSRQGKRTRSASRAARLAGRPVPGIDVVQLSSRLLRSGTRLPSVRRRSEPTLRLVPVLLVAAVLAAVGQVDQIRLAGDLLRGRTAFNWRRGHDLRFLRAERVVGIQGLRSGIAGCGRRSAWRAPWLRLAEVPRNLQGEGHGRAASADDPEAPGIAFRVDPHGTQRPGDRTSSSRTRWRTAARPTG